MAAVASRCEDGVASFPTEPCRPRLSRPHYRPDIDGLRAIAVLAVIAFHAFPLWVRGGFVGVDVFFVISGFLISTIIIESLQRNAFSFREFYSRRVRRIFPSLLAVMATSYVFGWFALLGDEYQQLGKHIVSAAGFVLNFILWSESGYFDASAETKPMLHLWSLGIEEQFYIVWPLLLWVAWKRRESLLLVILLLLIGSCFLNINGVFDDVVSTFYLPQTRAWEFLAGAALAYLSLPGRAEDQEHGQSGPDVGENSSDCVATCLRNVQSATGLILIMVAVLIVEKQDSFPGLWALIPVFGAVLVIRAGTNAWVNRVVLSHPAVVGIGVISYPLYLWHWPLLSFARLVQGEVPSGIVRLSAVLVAFALAWLTYVLLEKPVRYGQYNKRMTAMLVGLMIVGGGVGYATYQSGGLLFRNAVVAVAQQSKDLVFVSNRSRGVWVCDDAVFSEVHCELSGGSKPVAILIGDSHAIRLYAGLKHVYAEAGVPFALFGGKKGCPPFLDLMSEDRPDEGKRDCSNVTAALRYVLMNPTIEEVVMTSRGPLYTTGVGYGPIDHPHIYLRGSDHGAEVTDNRAAYVLSLEKTLAALQVAGKRVVFVFDNPELGFDPKLCLDVRPFRVETRKSPCSVRMSDYMARNLDYKTAVMRSLKKFDNVRTIDLSTVLCDDTICLAKVDGRFLYTDDDHLSEFGANFAVAALKNEFVHASVLLRALRLPSMTASATP